MPPRCTAVAALSKIDAMPFNVKTYVRYWDGRAVGYGQIVKVNDDNTYDVRVGGTDMVRKVSEGDISIHPVHVASGRKMDAWVMFTQVSVTGKWLYHATAYELLPSIITCNGIIPRANVDWSNLDVGWRGADSNRNENSPKVELSEYYKSMKTLTGMFGQNMGAEGMYQKTLMGDPGEFVYATTQPFTAASYLVDINGKRKKAIVFRFKSSKVWYRDPNQGSALINNMMVVLTDMEVKYVSGTDLFMGGDYVGDTVIPDEEGWVKCKAIGWRTVIDTAASLDNTV
jgi:hypothetical protein